MYISLVEQMVFRYPKGMEGFRFYRIEYGGHGKECVREGGIWLPKNMNPDLIEDIIINNLQGTSDADTESYK